MKTIFIITLLILASSTFAKNTDPLQQILDRLDGIENRLDKLEKSNIKSQASASSTSATTTPANTKTGAVTPNKATSGANKTKASPAKYKEGLIVELKPVKNEQQLKNPPLESIDAFIWNPDNTITETLIQKKKINLVGTVGFEIRGYLKIEKDGLYTLKINQKIKDVSFSDTFFIRGWLEGNVFLTTSWNSRTDKDGEYIAVGSTQLEPGIYKLRLWVGYKSSENKNKMERIQLQIKKPGELKFSSIKDMVYHKTK